MKKWKTYIQILIFILGIVPVLFATQSNIESTIKPSTYQLGVGDKLKIQVFREKDLEIETRVTDGGTIIFPLLGEVNALGLTIGELSEKIADGLIGRFIIDPQVVVTIMEYRDFYVEGEVQKPGAYPYVPGLTVYKAVAIAGGFSQRASRTDISLISDKDPKRIPQHVQLSSPVRPGDIVTIEESFF